MFKDEYSLRIAKVCEIYAIGGTSSIYIFNKDELLMFLWTCFRMCLPPLFFGHDVVCEVYH